MSICMEISLRERNESLKHKPTSSLVFGTSLNGCYRCLRFCYTYMIHVLCLYFQVVFMVNEGENIFTKDRLQQIHDIEKKIIAHEKFPEFCYKDIFTATVREDPAVKAINGCAPLNSLLTYFFPSTDHSGNVYYDGLGDNMDNIDSALKLAMTSTKFYYYVDDKVNSSYLKSQIIRTEVIFGTPLKG